jgi:hypothetical protein
VPKLFNWKNNKYIFIPEETKNLEKAKEARSREIEIVISPNTSGVQSQKMQRKSQ